MNKKLVFGLGTLAIGGAIMGGVMVASNQDNSLGIDDKNAEDVSAEDKQKIEELMTNEWKDDSKYGFCLAEASINTNYTDPILNGNGIVEYNSKEVLLYDKSAEKFFVMTRQSDYKYKGSLKMSLGGMAIDEPVNESGKIDETYERKEMPLRLDYANKLIFTEPDTKENTWVSSSIGEVTDMVMPHHGCKGKYPLDNASGKDLLVGAQQITINRDCKEKDINGVYDGDFAFKCSAITYQQAMEMIDMAKERQKLMETKDTNPMNEKSQEPDEKMDASASAPDDAQTENETDNEIRDAIDSSDEVVPDNEEIKKQLELLKEMQADQPAR